MIIKSLTLENYRSFKERTQLEFKNVNVFVGPNKAGKSNIIKCFQFLNAVSRGDWSDLFFENVFDSDLTKKITIEVEFSLDSQEEDDLAMLDHSNSSVNYENNSTFKQLKYFVVFQRDESIYEEKVSAIDAQGKSKELIPKSNNTKSMLPGYEESYAANLVIDFFRKMKIHYSAGIQNSLDFQGLVINRHENAVRRFVDFLDLSKDILGFPNIQVKHEGRKYKSVHDWRLKNPRIEFEDEGLTNPLPYFLLSYGSQQLLHILILADESESGEIICIEEPENGLHSHIQKMLFKEIMDTAKKKGAQFFITTHSPLFTTLEKDSVAIYLITDSEYTSIPMVAKAMNHGEIGTGIRLINCGGSSNIKKLRQFLQYLKYFDTKPIIMGDGHKEIIDTVEDFKRERLITDAIIRQKGKQFEDLFESERLVKVMKTMSEEQKFKFELTADELDIQRNNQNVATILEKYMCETNNGMKLDKTKLAKILALDIANEIGNNNQFRQETKLEQEINRIIEVIGKT